LAQAMRCSLDMQGHGRGHIIERLRAGIQRRQRVIEDVLADADC